MQSPRPPTPSSARSAPHPSFPEHRGSSVSGTSPSVTWMAYKAITRHSALAGLCRRQALLPLRTTESHAQTLLHGPIAPSQNRQLRLASPADSQHRGAVPEATQTSPTHAQSPAQGSAGASLARRQWQTRGACVAQPLFRHCESRAHGWIMSTPPLAPARLRIFLCQARAAAVGAPRG